MPEANVLYSVTALVIVGLVVWVAVVLKQAKEPWARALAPAVGGAGAVAATEGEVPAPSSAVPSSSLPRVEAGSATGSADATTDATPVILAPKKSDETKSDDEPKAEKLETDEEKLDEKAEKKS